ncbi:hypothetical protein [Bacillus toyonensis]|uniref:hypothetical protein n=1 Tax=Bacillus toyonensis TaxID=155322 RepID=UPI002E220403|nr:hypothetical protein [Bacillus toyonensis]
MEWYPETSTLLSNESIKAPKGCLIVKEESTNKYIQLKKLKAYSAELGSHNVWMGINCKGNNDNKLKINVEDNETSICELCKNEMHCMFKSKPTGLEKFDLHEEYNNLYRENFSEWVYKNKNSYDIHIKKHRGF